jgi:hypothetical protein
MRNKINEASLPREIRSKHIETNPNIGILKNCNANTLTNYIII